MGIIERIKGYFSRAETGPDLLHDAKGEVEWLTALQVEAPKDTQIEKSLMDAKDRHRNLLREAGFYDPLERARHRASEGNADKDRGRGPEIG